MEQEVILIVVSGPLYFSPDHDRSGNNLMVKSSIQDGVTYSES